MNAELLDQSPASPEITPVNSGVTSSTNSGKNSVTENPSMSATTFMLLKNARVLEEHGEFTLAFHILREAANRYSWDQRILSHLAKLLLQQHKFEEALRVSLQLKAKYPCFETTTLTAHILYRLEKDHAALEMYFEALSVLNEEHQELFEIYKNMGNIYVKMRDFEGAEEYYNKAHTISADSDILFVNYGTLEFQKGDYEKSRMCFRRAVELNTNNDRAWAGLAMVHTQFGDQELALGNILKSVELNPRNRTAHLLASEWLMGSQQWTTCIELLQTYLHANDHDEDLSLRLIHCFCELKKFDLAQIELTRCLVWNPQNQHLWKVMELLGNQ